MTFDTRERSISGGAPVRLYEFQRGLIRWRYTNADRSVIYQTRTYEHVPIADDGIRQGGEPQGDLLTVTLPADSAVARAYRAVPPASEIWLWIRDLHAGDTDAIVSYVGNVQGVNYPAPDRARIACLSLAASMDRPGLRMSWQRGCNNALYDHNCKVDRESFKVVTTIQSLSGETIESGAFEGPDEGYFAGGYIEWSIGEGEFDQRGIVSQSGSSLALLGGTAGLTAGQTVTAFAGCPLVAQICNDRFDNLPNYGGVPHLQGSSPFDGNPIF